MTDVKWDVELVDCLTDLADPKSPNRAALAHLRRGLDRSLDYTLGRVGWLFRRVPERSLEAAVSAAGLFAWMKGACPQKHAVNFGTAFGSGLSSDDKQRREKRFVDLLDTDKDELMYKLRQAITLIGRDGAGLDWVLLIKHLGHWDDADRWIQKDWARGFWAATTEDDVQPDVTVAPATVK